jgi:WD40 repeat protein
MFSDDGSRFGAATADGSVIVWQRDFAKLGQVCLNGLSERWVNDLVFRPGGKDLIAATTDNRLAVVRDTGVLQRELEVNCEVLCLAFDASGEYLLCGGRDGSISIWNMNSEKRILQWTAHDSSTGYVQFEPQGHVLSAGVNGEVRRWDVLGTFETISKAGIHLDLQHILDWTLTLGRTKKS